MVYIDYFTPLIDCLKGAYLTKCKKGSEHTLELLLPKPHIIDVETNELLTPFPFSVEMPILNPSFKVKKLRVEILDEAGKADNNRLKVN